MHFGIEFIGNIAAKIWNKIPNKIKKKAALQFISKIKKLVPQGCPCRLCRGCVGQEDFI